ncbi:hypothetical protein D3C76_1255910 [compost metagenome]
MLGGEQGIGRQRADQVQALGAQTCQGRLDDLQLFPAQMATFASVGIETADQDARPGDAELVHQVGMQDAADALQALGRDGSGDILERQVSGHQGHT